MSGGFVLCGLILMTDIIQVYPCRDDQYMRNVGECQTYSKTECIDNDGTVQCIFTMDCDQNTKSCKCRHQDDCRSGYKEKCLKTEDCKGDLQCLESKRRYFGNPHITLSDREYMGLGTGIGSASLFGLCRCPANSVVGGSDKTSCFGTYKSPCIQNKCRKSEGTVCDKETCICPPNTIFTSDPQNNPNNERGSGGESCRTKVSSAETTNYNSSSNISLFPLFYLLVLIKLY